MKQKNTNMATRYEHEIPEGYEARIEGGKVIIEPKESEDERIRKELVEFLDEVWHLGKNTNFDRWGKADCADWMAYLEKQKEQKPTGKINGEPISTENQTTNVGDDETETQKAGREKVFDHPKEYDLEKLYSVYGFKIGDKVRLRDGDGRTRVIKAFEEIEGIHGPDFYQVEFEDNSARGSIYPGEEYPNGYYTQMEKFEEEQQPAECEKSLLNKLERAVYDCAWGKVTCKLEGETKEEYAKRWAQQFLSMVRDWADDYIDSQIESAKREAYDKGKADAEKPVECVEFDNEFKNQVSHLLASVLNKEWEYNKGFVEYAAQQLLGYAKHEIKPAEWNERDKSILNNIIAYKVLNIDDLEWLKSLPERFNLQPKQEWSEEDENMLLSAIEYVQSYPAHRQSVVNWLQSKLKSFHPQPHWKPSEEQMKALKRAVDMLIMQYPGREIVLQSLYNELKNYKARNLQK